MDEQRSTYELAWNEVKHASQTLTSHAALMEAISEVEARLISKYPDDEPEIIRMVAAWMVRLEILPPSSLRGFV